LEGKSSLTDRLWRADFAEGTRSAAPLFLPILATALTFGALAAPVMGTVAPVVMSAVVFAGSAQFASVGILTAGGGATSAAVAGLLINGRFLAMGMAVTPSLSGGRLRRAMQGQAVVDASFVIAGEGQGRFNRHVLFGATALQAAAWVSGTAAGAALGSRLPSLDALGLDVLFPAFYLALLWPELRKRTAAMVAVASGVIALLLIPVAPPGLAILVAAAPALVGWWVR
jgi:4-azaleucine resistance transporter AzlC